MESIPKTAREGEAHIKHIKQQSLLCHVPATNKKDILISPVTMIAQMPFPCVLF